MVTLAGVALAVGLACAWAAETAPQGEAAADKDKGWISLFNGKDLKGWVNPRNADEALKWSVEDGTLTNVDSGNDIATKEQFTDFDIQLEYKTVTEGNSGLYLRGRVEIQIYDSHGVEEPTHADAGGIYSIAAPLTNASKPVGEWNKIEATFKGNELTVKLNGKVVQDKLKIDRVTGGALPGKFDEAGPIMLQGDHGKVWYRNIKIRPIKAQAAACCPAAG